MELRHLRYFEAVARTRNFTRAAEELGVAQPPLSRQVRALEIELGQNLFDRRERPVRLTEAGRLFYQKAAQIIADTEQLKESMRRFGSTRQRRFVIGVVGSIMYGGLPVTLRQFRQTAGEVEVELVELTTLEQVEALRDGRIDAGLGRIRITDPGVRREVLQEEVLVAALPARHPLATKASIDLAEIAAEPLIIYPRSPRPSYADQVLDLMRDHGINVLRTQEVREIQTALGLVAAEAGMAIVPISMRQIRQADIIYAGLNQPDAVSPVILSQRSNDDTSDSRLFRAIARRVFAGRAPDET